MTLNEAREIARLYFEEAFNHGNLAVIDELIAPGFKLYVPPSLGDAPVVQGRQAFADLVTGLRAAFGDLQFTVHETTVGGDVVMASWTMCGTHRAEWSGIPATGKSVTLTGVDVFRCEGGRILEERIHGDYLGLLRQLGALPAV